jgi:hypothetical protein
MKQLEELGRPVKQELAKTPAGEKVNLSFFKVFDA